MLWMKYWMETRWKLLLACGVSVMVMLIGYGQAHAAQNQPNPIPIEQRLEGQTGLVSLYLVMQSVILGGAGIKTQAPFRYAKGTHTSLQFTLSLPVSRLRLLATRASLGLVEIAGAILVGIVSLAIIFPVEFSELHFPVSGFAIYAFTLFAFLAASFSLSTLMSIFLDDVWQVWSSLLLIVGVRWLLVWVLPEKLDPFRAFASASPLMTHNIPWGAIVTSLLLSAVLLVASAKFVQRDY